MSAGKLQLIDLGRYGKALAWVRPGADPTIRAVETIEKTGGIRTVKATPEVIDRVMRTLRRD